MTFTPYVCKIFFFTLKFLSVILCFSGLCFDKASGLLCGLTPFAFVTVSSPHLGVKLLMGRAATWIKDTFSSLNTPSVQDLFLDERTDYLFLNPEEVKEDGALPKQVGAKEPSEPAPLLLEMTRKVVLNEQASGSFSVSNSLFFVVCLVARIKRFRGSRALQPSIQDVFTQMFTTIFLCRTRLEAYLLMLLRCVCFSFLTCNCQRRS